MVNLEKWEEIEHEDVKLGDKLKIVWVEKTPGLTTREVHKGKVSRLRNGEFWLAGSDTSWVSGDDEEEHTTVYRRKAKPFVFPTALGAVIEGELRYTSGPNRRYVRLSGRWVSVDGSMAIEEALAANFKNWKVLSEGVTA